LEIEKTRNQAANHRPEPMRHLLFLARFADLKAAAK
jgi:hypothetical protein